MIPLEDILHFVLCIVTILLLRIHSEISASCGIIQKLEITYETENNQIPVKTVRNIIEQRDKQLNINCPLKIFQNSHQNSQFKKISEGPLILVSSDYKDFNGMPMTLLTSDSAERSHRRFIEVNKYSQSEQFSNNFQFRRLSSNCEYMVILGMQAESMINLKTITQLSNKNHYYFIVGEFPEIKAILQHDVIQKLKFKIGIPAEIQFKTRTVVESEEGAIKLQSVDLKWIFEQRKFIRNHNLNNPFKFTTFDLAPHYVKTRSGKLIGDAAISIASAAHAYNFSYTLKALPVGGGPNGTPGNFTEELIHGQLDGHLYSNEDINTTPFMDQSSYCVSIYLTFYIAKPKVRLNWRALQIPFQNSLWLLLLVLLVSLSLVFTAHILTVHIKTVLQPTDPISHAVLITIAPLLAQNQNLVLKKSGNVQFLLVMWFFGASIIQTYYDSNLLSCITVPLKEIVPQSFEELSTRSDFNIVLQKLPGAPCDVFFQKTKDPVFISLRERLVKEFNPFLCLYPLSYRADGGTIEEEHYENSTAKTACIGWKHLVGQVIAKNFTQTGGLTPFVSPIKNALTVFLTVGFPKQSKIKEEFDWIFKWFRDTGHILKWTKDVSTYNQNIGTSWKKSQSKLDKFEKVVQGLISEKEKFIQNDRTQKPFEIRYLLVAFGLMFFGSILGLILYLLEKILYCLELERDRTTVVLTYLP